MLLSLSEQFHQNSARSDPTIRLKVTSDNEYNVKNGLSCIGWFRNLGYLGQTG